jgi:hypothetical protein
MSEPVSVFSNRAGDAERGAGDYVRAVLALLGDQDPFAVLAATPGTIEQALAGLDEAGLQTPERPGKWSLAQVVHHLADSELVWGYRLRRVLADERPAIEGYDQDVWAERLRYAGAPLQPALDLFTTLREANLRLLRTAPAADLDRVGVHAERGEESVAHMVKLYAGHDLLHLRQLARIRAAVG